MNRFMVMAAPIMILAATLAGGYGAEREASLGARASCPP